MAISVGTGNNAVSSKESTVRLRVPVKHEDLHEQYAQSRARLTQALQTSLELTIVLEIFFEHIQKLVPIQGFHYGHPGKNCQLQLGRDGLHRLNYRLNTPKDNLGAITFSRGKRFTEVEMATLESVISTLVYPLRNALQYRDAVQSALRDPLTGTGNRVALEQTLERELSLAQRNCQPLSLLAIDIDHFKRVNDSHGHASGDEVLREVAQGIVAVTRQTDLTFRYGGEEFVVVLNKTDAEGARVIAERIRLFVEKLRVETHNELLQVTISIGVSSLQAEEEKNSLFQRADKALYNAKRNGRNRVEVAKADQIS
ncbi:GGDEF domain-containing protein [Pseudomaricurvus alkylphenolicus]|jgi:diguanylate cyclase (GGDEF)-like protein|uniref:GGDEF domain-containing protein n=1 Tax=Pseudomaricurvus alkylphenolicus TaxID=1306991 RepID=UPI00141F97F7|nr:GGDEF domain-containing protein [Pseudomaricurvus alkylphenolicus]NIB41302.1 GGDEF domain-containing protein [Pseudomaricurvus alkylphenolicus]